MFHDFFRGIVILNFLNKTRQNERKLTYIENYLLLELPIPKSESESRVRLSNSSSTLYLEGTIPHSPVWPSRSTSHADQCPGTPLYMVLSMKRMSSFLKAN